MPARWRKGPRPDPDVIQLVDKLAEAAREGRVRALVVVTVNPLLEVESAEAGDLENVKKHLLMGGLSAAKHRLLNNGN